MLAWSGHWGASCGFDSTTTAIESSCSSTTATTIGSNSTGTNSRKDGGVKQVEVEREVRRHLGRTRPLLQHGLAGHAALQATAPDWCGVGRSSALNTD